MSATRTNGQRRSADTSISSLQILFEDGDSLSNVRYNALMTEKQYMEKYKKKPPAPEHKAISEAVAEKPPPFLLLSDDGGVNSIGISTALSLSELKQKQCGNCLMCREDDCGRCSACVENASSTLRVRQMCLLKVNTSLSLSMCA